MENKHYWPSFVHSCLLPHCPSCTLYVIALYIKLFILSLRPTWSNDTLLKCMYTTTRSCNIHETIWMLQSLQGLMWRTCQRGLLLAIFSAYDRGVSDAYVKHCMSPTERLWHLLPIMEIKRIEAVRSYIPVDCFTMVWFTQQCDENIEADREYTGGGGRGSWDYSLLFVGVGGLRGE